MIYGGGWCMAVDGEWIVDGALMVYEGWCMDG